MIPQQAEDIAVQTAQQAAARTKKPWRVYRRTTVRDWRSSFDPDTTAGMIHCDVLYIIQAADKEKAPTDAEMMQEVHP